VTTDEYLSSITADSDRIGAVGSAAIDSRVPSCPDWAVADLITHVGWVHRYVTYLAGLPDGGRETREGRAPFWKGMMLLDRPDADLIPWFREGADELVQALRKAPPRQTTHTFYGVHQPWLLMRRAATETAIHRWDADGAVGAPAALEPSLGVAGIDEFLGVLLPRFFNHADFGGTGQTIRLEGTDGDDAWVITVEADTTKWRRSRDTLADVTARGGLSDLYLFFWGRPAADPLDVVGDHQLLARWQAAVAF
jgi:uncharacterized protein (TIGR03083 family)